MTLGGFKMRYNEYEIEAIVSKVPMDKAESMFCKLPLEDLYYLSSVFSENQDCSINKYRSVISKVIDKKKEGFYQNNMGPLTSDEGALIHLAIDSLADYLERAEEEYEYNYDVQRRVSPTAFEELYDDNDSLSNNSFVKRMLLYMKNDGR